MNEFQRKMKQLGKYPFVQPFQTIFSSEREQQKFIESILKEEQLIIDVFDQPLPHDPQQPWLADTFTPAERALDWLLQQPKDWLNEHQYIFQDLYEIHRQNQKKNATSQAIIEKIRMLVSQTGAGINFVFFNSLLRKEQIGKIEELNFRLLQAKIIEKMAPSTLKDKRREQLDNICGQDKKVHLQIVQLYDYRKSDPQAAIQSLYPIDVAFDTPNAIRDEYLPELKPIVVQYLSDAIFVWLRAGVNDDYAQFFVEKKRMQSKWMIQIFDTALNQPGLELIKEKFDRMDEDTLLLSPQRTLSQLDDVEELTEDGLH